MMSAERRPRTLHRSTMSGWMCLARPGGAVRVGAETHRRAGFCVGLVNLCPVTTAHKEGYVPLNLCPFTSAQTNLTGTNHLTGLSSKKTKVVKFVCICCKVVLKQVHPIQINRSQKWKSKPEKMFKICLDRFARSMAIFISRPRQMVIVLVCPVKSTDDWSKGESSANQRLGVTL